MNAITANRSFLFDLFMSIATAVTAVCIVFIFWTFFSESTIWENMDVFKSPGIKDAVIISMETSLTVVAVTFVIGLPAAYILAVKEFRGKVIIDTLIDLPIVFPPLISGLALLLLLGPEGPVGSIFDKLDFRIIFTKKAVIIAQTFVAAPFFIKTVRESIAAIPKNLLSASYMLRGSRLYTFFHVILPLSKNGIWAGLVICWTRALGEFGATAMVAGCIPGHTETMTLSIYSKTMSGNYQGATATAFVLTIFAFVSLIVMKSLFKRNNHVY